MHIIISNENPLIIQKFTEGSNAFRFLKLFIQFKGIESDRINTIYLAHRSECSVRHIRFESHSANQRIRQYHKKIPKKEKKIP